MGQRSYRTIGFIGGTGPEGRGLALRFALAGEDVVIGSRDLGRAEDAARSTLVAAPAATIRGVVNADAARMSDIVFVVVPYGGHRETLEVLSEHLTGKVVVDVVAPLSFDGGKVTAVRVDEGSAALQAQAVLTQSSVVAAFQTISARDLLVPERPIDSDVVVCSDADDAKSLVIELAEKIQGVRGVDGGGIENARYVEDFTALLLNINRIYKAHSAVKIVGI